MPQKDAWADKDFADRWDNKNHFRENPDRGEQLDLIVRLLVGGCHRTALILDLGSGSGRVEELIFEQIPGVRLVGVDSSPAMMEIALKRLAPHGERFIPIIGKMNELEKLPLPEGPYTFAISIQALHEVPHIEKHHIMSGVFNLLVPGGTFLLLDRVAFEGKELFTEYQSVWVRLNRKTEMENEMTYTKYLEAYRKKDDYVATLEEQLSWLREAGFTASCLYLHFNRALLAARRPMND